VVYHFSMNVGKVCPSLFLVSFCIFPSFPVCYCLYGMGFRNGSLSVIYFINSNFILQLVQVVMHMCLSFILQHDYIISCELVL
jgi:hypothetical protein